LDWSWQRGPGLLGFRIKPALVVLGRDNVDGFAVTGDLGYSRRASRKRKE
jgi:hypothetical protein